MEKRRYPAWSHAAHSPGVQPSATSSPSIWASVVDVHVCFLLGRCFPILVTLHHSDREEQTVRGGGGRTSQRCECDEVPSLQRKHRGPGVSLAHCVGGAPLSKSLSLSFWEVKRDTCFLKVRIMSTQLLFHLRRCIMRQQRLWSCSAKLLI